MTKIFKNMLPYWKMILLILVLLTVQAFCDLSLPQYTSNIIDVGIQNKGVSHILPAQITKEEYDMAQLFMTEEEKNLWQESYQEDGALYSCIVTDEKRLASLDEALLTPLVLTYQMGNMSEAEFKSTIGKAMKANPLTAAMADKVEDMTIEQIGAAAHVELSAYEGEDEDGNPVTYVDMRPLMEMMQQSGTMSAETLTESRKTMEGMISSMGSSTLKARGIAYAIACETAAGVDVDHGQISYLWVAGARMLDFAVLIMLASILVGFLASRVGAGVGRDLRSGIFSKVVRFSNTEMDQFSTASLITRSTNDIQQIQMVTAVFLRMILYAPILGIGGIIKIAQTGANMGWVICLAVLVILAFVLLLMSVAMPKFKMMQVLVDKVNLVSREILTGLSVIRAFGREKTEEERFDEANKELTRTQLFTNRVMTFMMPGMMLIMNGVSVLIVWVAAGRINDGTMQVGAMTAFITYTMQIIMAFLMLTMMSIMLPRAGVAAERIDEVLQTESSIKEREHPEHITEKRGVVRFSHVNFRYPGAESDVLEDIDFTAEPGKTTAIIGSTGCGKSTLVNLIPRFYDITSGSLTVDGKEVKDLSLPELRDEIGFVPQKGVLFSGTIASNLRFGRPDATDDEIREAAEIAQATEFIDEKRDTYDSEIAQGGSNVSGGQKQRLAIARAIAKKPKIFVFDDSFSALDMKTDQKLRAALAEKGKDSTTIIVAQRISTVIHAEQILVLDEGRIVGKGTHSELLADCEVYQQIARSQLSAKELGLKEGEEEERHE